MLLARAYTIHFFLLFSFFFFFFLLYIITFIIFSLYRVPYILMLPLLHSYRKMNIRFSFCKRRIFRSFHSNKFLLDRHMECNIWFFLGLLWFL